MEANHFPRMIWVTDMVLLFPSSPHVASIRLCSCCTFHLWCLFPLASVKPCLSSKALVQLLRPLPQQANCVYIYNPCNTHLIPLCLVIEWSYLHICLWSSLMIANGQDQDNKLFPLPVRELGISCLCDCRGDQWPTATSSFWCTRLQRPSFTLVRFIQLLPLSGRTLFYTSLAGGTLHQAVCMALVTRNYDAHLKLQEHWESGVWYFEEAVLKALSCLWSNLTF